MPSQRMTFKSCLLLAIALLSVTSWAATDPQTLVDQGQRAFQKGDFRQAAADWQSAADVYRKQGNAKAEIQTSVSLASACQSLGQHRRTVQLLESALTQAETVGDKQLITLVKSKLGGALVLTQETQRATTLLEEALTAARGDKNSVLTAAILNDLGNAQAADQKFGDALKSCEESSRLAQQAGNAELTAQSLCNAAATALRANDFRKADELNAQAISAIGKLDNSHAKTFLLLTAGQTDRQIKLPGTEEAKRLMLRAYQSFQEASKIAEPIGDRAMETYALGYLGQLYEQDGQTESALQLTRRAAFIAQEAQLPEALYQWEAQTGRLLKQQGKSDQAIAAYRRAVQSLQPIRTDIASGFGNASSRLSFRESVGPIFYDLADLLLVQAKAASNPKQQQELLLEARDTVESLKTVELEEYFCDECVDVLKLKTQAVEAIDEHSAVIYLIPLPARTEMLVGTSSGLKLFTVNVSSPDLTAQVRDFRRNLETRTTFGYLEQAQQLYDWFIRPIQGFLKENQINTLVVVSDGALRTIPFAALHDGEQFLVQNFAVAVVPGLSLVDPKALERKKVRLLLNGVSRSVQNFAPLDFVTNELSSIDHTYSSEILLNEQFTLAALQNKLRDEQFSVVHIASHGQFDRDVRKTFVLTYDDKLTLNELEASIRPSQYRGRPVEMLVLSACQTAAGDDRAALGLAGIAIKAGARSALASLWFVNDQSTSELVTEFYNQLHQSPTITKAQALQAAQMKLLSDRRYRHPCYWSPYLIIGNWL
ncbi:MAG TPA: CHAT domain-containing protein [Verrucomicrobiae bacterium]|nr:CHAT domain-containing protein [Verrucomicrobiae bacterium]